MKTSRAAHILESKQLLANKKVIALFLLLSLISLYFVQMGINNYKNIIDNKDKFLHFERLKVKQYINYAQYGVYGFRVLFIPSPLSAYFVNSSTISELTANVDSGERLNIYYSFKGKALFIEKLGGFKDFSGMMLLLGSLLVLYLGYESTINKDYLRFMTGFINYKGLFFSIVFSRMSVIIAFFLVNIGASWLLLEFNNIKLVIPQYVHLLAYLAILVLMQVFFFSLGTLTGSMKSRFAGFVMVVISWFVFVFLLPGVVSTVISRKADNIVSNYQLEVEKLEKMMDIEKRAIREVGPQKKWQDNAEAVREHIEQIWNNEFKELLAFEKKLEKEMIENIRHFQTLSCLFPSTFYLSGSDEISSKGYENFILFFNYIQELKKRFVRFYIDKSYYPDPGTQGPKNNLTNNNYNANEKVESFIKNHENLFVARSRFPKGFIVGVLLTLVYIVGLLCVSYYRFKKSLRL